MRVVTLDGTRCSRAAALFIPPCSTTALKISNALKSMQNSPKENGGFFFTSHDHESLIVRNKDFTDNATPSGNSVTADVFLKLAKLTGDENYERYATKVLSIAAGQARRYPQGFGRALAAMEFAIQPTREIVLVGDANQELAQVVWDTFLPNKIVASILAGSEVSDLLLLEGKTAIDGKPTAYVCENFVCDRPVTTAEDLRAKIS